ncbi:DUF4405 domain-containing protein [Thermococcus sp.]|uniref:DUF4405 domain-containing protein n=1 Tax=Thermococcus sp. TaxID=35749 RepID=UPI002603F5AD|nr:DUF4405 domain-containing protein [Thermococcus sp.]
MNMGRWTAPAWLRGSIDLLLTLVFTVMAVSGIALYLAPSGRIAETLGWTFLGLNKDTWTEIHTYMGFAMIGLVAVHLAVGFRSMLTMLKSALRKAKWKPIAATAVMLLALAGGFRVYATYYGEGGDEKAVTVELPSNVSSLTVEITGSMLKSYTLEQVAKLYNVSPTDLASLLKSEYGINAQPDELLDEVITNNGLDREAFKEELTEAIEKLRGGEG